MTTTNKSTVFHIHTSYSYDSILNPQKIVDYLVDKNINQVIITDHNEILGALKAREYAKKKYSDLIEIIVGEEIKTDIGDIIGFPLFNKIYPGKYSTVIKKIKEQNAFVCLPHPYKEHDLFEIHSNRFVEQVDYVEVYNSRILNKQLNDYALSYAEYYNKKKILGCDAHLAKELLLVSFNWDSEYNITFSKKCYSNPRNIRKSILIKLFKNKKYYQIPYNLLLLLLGK